MNNIKWQTVIPLTLALPLLIVVVVLVWISLTNKSNSQQEIANTIIPIYKSDHSNTVIYNSKGILNYGLIALHVEYFLDGRFSWITLPVLTTFDNNGVPTWLIKCDRAKLTNDHMLYLYGHVEVKALNVVDSQFCKITTDNVLINLITLEITALNLVKLYGTTFSSSSLRMHGNLRRKNAMLIDKVKTSYEVQNKQNYP